MKVVMITDLHFGSHNDHPVHAFHLEKFFDWFWGEMDRLDHKVILNLGDTMDVRTRISYPAMYQLKHHLLDPVEKSGSTMHTIVGNHDAFGRTSLDMTAKVLMEDKVGMRVYDEPADITLPDGSVIGMIPWIHKNNIDQITEYLKNTPAEYIFGHLEVSGAQMMRGIACDHGQDSSLFNRFKAVFSGHFHHKNTYGNIHYIGNIRHMNWGDYGETRGYTVFDTDTGEFEIFENPYSPFVKYHYDDVDYSYEDLSYLDEVNLENMLVKVIVVRKNNPYYLDRYVQKLTDRGAYSVQVVEHDSVEFSGNDGEVEQEDIKEFKADTLTVLEDHVGNTTLSEEQTKRVMKIMRELYAEAQSRSAME